MIFCSNCGKQIQGNARFCDACATPVDASALSSAPVGGKNRHGCLTAILILMIFANSVTALAYLLGGNAMRSVVPNAPGWIFTVLLVGSLFNLACSIALFQWKKWGFWGFCVNSAVVFGINRAIGMGAGTSVLGLLGILLLYGVLHIGGEKNGWSQLE